jgi:hypothetical protein
LTVGMMIGERAGDSMNGVAGPLAFPPALLALTLR